MLLNIHPRRLALLAGTFFVVAILFLRQTSYEAYLPDLDWKKSGRKSSLEEDQQVAPGRVETPSNGGLEVPGKASSSSLSAVKTTSAAEEQAWGIAQSTSADLPGQHSTTQGPNPTSGPSSGEVAHPSATAESNHTDEGSQPLAHESYESVQIKIQEIIKDWTPPAIGGHWPPYDGYYDKDYDPNRWEAFEWDNDFYLSDGIHMLEEKDVRPQPYSPYPEYNSAAWKTEWKGQYVPCKGARGKLLNESDEDVLKAYPAMPENFPHVAIGDAAVTGMDLDHCFDRNHRYGPYGYGSGSSDSAIVGGWQHPTTEPDWLSVHWGQLQDECLAANKERYAPTARQPVELAPGKKLPQDTLHKQVEDAKAEAGEQEYSSRTALLIRTWEGYQYTENDIQAIRALITELSLLSGGEYQVFLFVNVKDRMADIFNNQQVYDDILKQNVPRELQSISILWNEMICEEWYPRTEDWQVYWHQFMPLQWFSKTHPEFDFVWNWETDARYTGNHYHFMEGVANFSKQFPRKHMWERNQRFYFPSAHGTYDQWLADTDRTIETGMREGTVDPVWGPKPYSPADQQPVGPVPPRSMKEDQFEWGVGEEADLITLQPIWDPTHTEWTYRDKIWNFVTGVRPHFSQDDPLDQQFHHPEFANIPRRTYINTLSRFSQRQLHAMHVENLAGRTTQAEMWPATVALQHGLKAVYAPHPIWTDRKWPAWYMDAVFNADGGKTAQWGQQADSVYNHDREHNFGGWSWYYQSVFPKSLYRRWLGWSAQDDSPLSNIGGKPLEEGGAVADLGDGIPEEIGGHGRMCLPPMLLHPVKKVKEDAI